MSIEEKLELRSRPKKILVHEMMGAICPECKKQLFHAELGDIKFCFNCGQALDWTPEKPKVKLPASECKTLEELVESLDLKPYEPFTRWNSEGMTHVWVYGNMYFTTEYYERGMVHYHHYLVSNKK